MKHFHLQENKTMDVTFFFDPASSKAAELVYEQLSEVDQENCSTDADLNSLDWYEIHPKRLHCVVDIIVKPLLELGLTHYTEIQLIRADGLKIDDHYDAYLKQHKITLVVTHYVGYQVGTKNLV